MLIKGRIVKGIAGFYYVDTQESLQYECKAKGSFRNEKQKPLVGDFVEIAIVDEEKKKGNIEKILPRSSQLIRPAVANVDQALVIFALKSPEPNFFLLDTFLARMELLGLPSIICFNKADLDADGSLEAEIRKIYEKTEYKLVFVCARQNEGISDLEDMLRGKCTTVAGPSGVGKSTIVNLLQDQICMETSGISVKTERGKHTTRHSQLIAIDTDTYILDTPGFTSLSMEDYEKEEIAMGFPEIHKWESGCRFAGCSHVAEPDCQVKEKLSQGLISPRRYENYVTMYKESKDKRRY